MAQRIVTTVFHSLTQALSRRISIRLCLCVSSIYPTNLSPRNFIPAAWRGPWESQGVWWTEKCNLRKLCKNFNDASWFTHIHSLHVLFIDINPICLVCFFPSLKRISRRAAFVCHSRIIIIYLLQTCMSIDERKKNLSYHPIS